MKSGREFQVIARSWCVAFLVVAGIERATAQPVPLRSNGPDSNRVNIAVLAEGYTSGQSNLFLQAATNAVATLISTPPLSDYSNHFNAVALFVASAQSGSDHPVSGRQVNTFFNSTYDPTSDLLITIPPNWANSNPADGQGKVDALLATNAIEADLVVLLVNDSVEGGSDGGGGTVIASANYPVILSHEAGHVLANLGDEYEWANPGFPDVEEPNTTRETNRASIKWNAWIEATTPVPTPETGAYAGVVGLFEGAHYHSTGWYRPRFECAMRSQGSPFCEVCAEALVLALYERVRPIEVWFPAVTDVVANSDAPLQFSVSLVAPASHPLGIQWFTNDVPVSGAVLPFFELNPAELENGTHEVRVVVRDPTTRVRTDPSALLEQMVTWTVDVEQRWLRMEPGLEQGALVIRIVGEAPNGFVVESSQDLLGGWIPYSTNLLVNGEAWLTNPLVEPFGFYRAMTRP